MHWSEPNQKKRHFWKSSCKWQSVDRDLEGRNLNGKFSCGERVNIEYSGIFKPSIFRPVEQNRKKLPTKLLQRNFCRLRPRRKWTLNWRKITTTCNFRHTQFVRFSKHASKLESFEKTLQAEIYRFRSRKKKPDHFFLWKVSETFDTTQFTVRSLVTSTH